MRFYDHVPSHSSRQLKLVRLEQQDLIINFSKFFVADSWRTKIVHSNSDFSTSNKHSKIMLVNAHQTACHQNDV